MRFTQEEIDATRLTHKQRVERIERRKAHQIVEAEKAEARFEAEQLADQQEAAERARKEVNIRKEFELMRTATVAFGQPRYDEKQIANFYRRHERVLKGYTDYRLYPLLSDGEKAVIAEYADLKRRQCREAEIQEWWNGDPERSHIIGQRWSVENADYKAEV